mgnify:CR=1 FL=1
MKNFKKDIRSLSKLELQNFFLSNQISPYKGTQVYKWLWEKGIHNFDEMTNFIISEKGDEVISERHQKDYSSQKSDENENSEFSDVDFNEV